MIINTLKWNYYNLDEDCSWAGIKWNETIIAKINQASANIFQKNFNGGANKIFCNNNIFNFLKELENFHFFSERYKVFIDDLIEENCLYIVKDFSEKTTYSLEESENAGNLAVKIEILNFKKELPMKIIFVNQPMQDENTLEPQLINGEIKKWKVKGENLKINQTLKEFLTEKWIYVKNKFGDEIKGFYIYDVLPIHEIINEKGEYTGDSGIHIRYDYIKK